jgi:FkbM family methyltransferase
MIQDPLQKQLDELLGPDVEALRHREQTAFDQRSAPRSGSLVIFGAGGLGRMTLRGLRRVGVEPLAFADNNPAAWGSSIEGIPVLSPEDAARQYKDKATFVVAIWRANGKHRLAQFVRQLEELGCQRVVSFGFLYWKYHEVFLPYYALDLPHKIAAQKDDVRRAFALLADEQSRREFVMQMRWRLLLDFDCLASPVADLQYFPEDLFSWRPDEVFVDCGAFDGDTIKVIMGRAGPRFERIVAFEPDPMNFQKLQAYCQSLPETVRQRITCLPLAAGDRKQKVRFAAGGTAASSVGSGDIEVEGDTLDAVLGDTPVTYLKMDIEGAEPEALAGAAGVITKHKPVLAVCVYHKQDHLWRLPLMMQGFSKDYRLFLRPHNEECWDLICYAVPVGRLRRK